MMEKIQGSKVLKRKTRTDRKPLKLFLKPRLYSCPEFLNDLNLLLEECGVFQQTDENLTPQVNKPCHLKSFCKADGEGVDLRIFFHRLLSGGSQGKKTLVSSLPGFSTTSTQSHKYERN